MLKTISYGTLAKRRLTPALRATARQKAQVDARKIILSELRKLTGKTQTEVARKMGIAQSNLSRLEKQEDIQWKTLRKLAETLGVKLSLVATTPDGVDHVLMIGSQAKQST